MKINELSFDFEKLKVPKKKRLIKIKSEIYKRENKKSKHNLKSPNSVAKSNNLKLALWKNQ